MINKEDLYAYPGLPGISNETDRAGVKRPSGHTGKTILMVSRAIEAPWDEASRNLVRDIISRVDEYDFHILTTGAAGKDRENVFPERIYSSRNNSLAQKIRLFWFLLRNRSRFDLYHFCFTPEPVTSFLIRRMVTKNKRMQTIPYLSPKVREGDYGSLIYSHAVTVTSRYTKDILEKNGIKGVSVVYPGVDTGRFSPGNGKAAAREKFRLPDMFQVLWAGDLSSDAVVRAMSGTIRRVCRAEKDIGFIIASRIKAGGDLRRRWMLAKEIEREGFQDRVVFMDTVDDMAALIAASDVVIYPFFSGFTRKIDIPHIVVEAMASGKPVVISDRQPLNEVIMDGAGLAVKGEDIRNFADTITMLYNDKDIRQELGRRNRDAALRYFDARNNVEKFARIYETLLV